MYSWSPIAVHMQHSDWPKSVVIPGHIPTLLSAATVSFNAEMTYQNFMAHLSNLQK